MAEEGLVQPAPSPSHLTIWVTYGYHTDLASGLKLVLMNARYVKKKTSFIRDLILDEERDVVCINETWAMGELDVHLQTLCFPVFRVQHQPRTRGAWRRGPCCLRKQYHVYDETCSAADGCGVPLLGAG